MNDHNPYQPPEADLLVRKGVEEPEYVGFWSRVIASLIDTALMIALLAPMIFFMLGDQLFAENSPLTIDADTSTILFLIQYIIPAVIIILFWVYRSATPGKMIISARIVDADTGEKPSTGQLLIRYVGYYLSTLTLMLGFLWVSFDKRKQGFHDKLSNTVVIRER